MTEDMTTHLCKTCEYGFVKKIKNVDNGVIITTTRCEITEDDEESQNMTNELVLECNEHKEKGKIK